MEEWKEYNFTDITINYDKNRIPLSSKERETRKGEYRYFGAQGVIDYIDNYIFDGQYILLAEDGENLKSKKQSLVQFVSGKFWVNNHAHILTGNEKCYIKFLFYLLDSTDFTPFITGSAQPKLSQQSLSKIYLKLPPLPTQQKIVAILSSLDDKIELNNKINTNLEQQAQALFKNWFVDFEPSGGKMPEGWRVGTLCDIADYSSEKIEINKLTPETYYSTENMLPNKGGIETATSLPSISQTTRCLPGETIISNIRPYFKKIFYCTEEVAGCSTDVLCFKPKNKDYSEFIYQVLYSDIFFDYMVLGSKGTKMPRGDKQQIMNYPITIPDELYLRKFKTFAKPIFSQIDSKRKENKRLSELRDTLLPKLINGEIEVN